MTPLASITNAYADLITGVFFIIVGICIALRVASRRSQENRAWRTQSRRGPRQTEEVTPEDWLCIDLDGCLSYVDVPFPDGTFPRLRASRRRIDGRF
jgi:hypothetical protein